MTYKVTKEDGVIIDGVAFAFDEVMELDSEAFNVPELIAEGSIVEVEEEVVDEAEPMDAEIPADEVDADPVITDENFSVETPAETV